MEFNLKALTVKPEGNKGTSKGPRVINFVVPSVYKPNLFRP